MHDLLIRRGRIVDRTVTTAIASKGACGYRATIAGGVVTREDDSDTGARPGRLLRGGR